MRDATGRNAAFGADEQLAKDPIEAGDGGAGLQPEACDDLSTKKTAMIGSDTWELEAFPLEMV